MVPRQRLQHFAIHLALILAIMLVAFPLVFAFIKATQSGAQIISPDMRPGKFFFQNLEQAWVGAKLGLYMRNSFIVAVAVTFFKVVLSAFAALALVYFGFPFSRLVFALILFTLMLPTDLLIVALFDLIGKLGWSNTYQAIIVPFLASATGTFLLRQHFMNVPRSLADSARIDGAGPLRFLVSILLPMSYNTIGALVLIQFIYVWDQYLWPLIIIRDPSHQVVQVGLRSLISQVGSPTDWGMVMAGALVTLVPPILVFTLLQEQFSRGFVLAEEK